MYTPVVTLSRVANRKKVAPMPIWKQLIIWTLFFTCIVGMFHVNTSATKTLDYFIGAFGTVSFAYFLFKMILSFAYRPDIAEPAPGIKVSVVVPSYNENPESVLKTIQCLLDQDYPLHEIFFVDDGSKDLRGYEAVKQLADEIEAAKQEAAASLEGGRVSRYHWAYAALDAPRIIVHRFEKNRGKRNAQAWAFRQATGDFLMIVDSDGDIYPDAVRELLKPFHDPEVKAVTGHVNARNRRDNWITRLQDVLYESAFRVGRGAMSVTGSVIVCSGAISMFRRDTVLRNLEAFEKETLFGKSVQVGDDRRLTTIALSEGKVKYQSTARCITDVPVEFGKFFKQQVRWSKSFYVETIKALKIGIRRPFVLIWLLGEGLIWLTFGSSVILSWIFNAVNFQQQLLIYSASYLILSTLASNVYYIFKHPLIYLLSPVFGLVHMMMIFPIRFYALLTLNANGWGTR
jgi:hyaluronan synthase